MSESLPLAQVILGLRGAQLGWDWKNPIKMLTFWQLTLQCCHHCQTVSISCSSAYSKSSAHPLSESSTLCSLSSSMKSVYPMLQKTNSSLTSHHIFTNLNVKTAQKDVIEFSSFIGRKLRFETGFSLAVFSKTTKVEFVERGPRSAVRNVLTQ